MKTSTYIEEILAKPAELAAPLLIGCRLRRSTAAGDIELQIVETEAYHQSDPASHTFRGLTKRTAPMFEPGGVLYIYLSYGVHYCMNIVTGQAGVGEAVLIRAAMPVVGVDIMQRNRNQTDIRNIANGPGKLCQALGITSTELSGSKIGPKTINLLAPAEKIEINQIVSTPRIGITKAVDLPWRFYLKNSPFVSK